jgi:hypothetical protein
MLKPKGAVAVALSTFDGKAVLPLTVLVEAAPMLPDASYGEFRGLGEFGLNTAMDDSLTKVFSKTPATRFASLTIPFMVKNPPAEIADVVDLLFNTANPDLTKAVKNATLDGAPFTLASGTDGSQPTATAYIGEGDSTKFLDLITSDAFTKTKNGFMAFEAVPDISIVAAPGGAASMDVHINSGCQSPSER